MHNAWKIKGSQCNQSYLIGSCKIATLCCYFFAFQTAIFRVPQKRVYVSQVVENGEHKSLTHITFDLELLGYAFIRFNYIIENVKQMCAFVFFFWHAQLPECIKIVMQHNFKRSFVFCLEFHGIRCCYLLTHNLIECVFLVCLRWSSCSLVVS